MLSLNLQQGQSSNGIENLPGFTWCNSQRGNAQLALPPIMMGVPPPLPPPNTMPAITVPPPNTMPAITDGTVSDESQQHPPSGAVQASAPAGAEQPNTIVNGSAKDGTMSRSEPEGIQGVTNRLIDVLRGANVCKRPAAAPKHGKAPQGVQEE